MIPLQFFPIFLQTGVSKRPKGSTFHNLKSSRFLSLRYSADFGRFRLVTVLESFVAILLITIHDGAHWCLNTSKNTEKTWSFKKIQARISLITMPIGEVLKFSRINKNWFSPLSISVFKNSQKFKKQFDGAANKKEEFTHYN